MRELIQKMAKGITLSYEHFEAAKSKMKKLDRQTIDNLEQIQSLIQLHETKLNKAESKLALKIENIYKAFLKNVIVCHDFYALFETVITKSEFKKFFRWLVEKKKVIFDQREQTNQTINNLRNKLGTSQYHTFDLPITNSWLHFIQARGSHDPQTSLADIIDYSDPEKVKESLDDLVMKLEFLKIENERLKNEKSLTKFSNGKTAKKDASRSVRQRKGLNRLRSKSKNRSPSPVVEKRKSNCEHLDSGSWGIEIGKGNGLGEQGMVNNDLFQMIQFQAKILERVLS